MFGKLKTFIKSQRKYIKSFVISFVMLLLVSGLMLGFILGGHIVFLNYRDESDINITRDSHSDMAKIKIIDKYTKADGNYIEFTTDKTGAKKFLLSEEDYNKYIGKDCNAVDYTEYRVNLYTTIGKISCRDYAKKYIQDNKIYDIDSLPVIYDEYSIRVARVDDVKYDGFDVIVDFDDDFNYNVDMTLKHYSFLGETDFTDEELGVHKKNIDIICNSVLYNMRNSHAIIID